MKSKKSKTHLKSPQKPFNSKEQFHQTQITSTAYNYRFQKVFLLFKEQETSFMQVIIIKIVIFGNIVAKQKAIKKHNIANQI